MRHQKNISLPSHLIQGLPAGNPLSLLRGYFYDTLAGMEIATNSIWFAIAGVIAFGFILLGVFVAILWRKVRMLFGPVAAENTKTEKDPMQQNLLRRVHALEMKTNAWDANLQHLERAARFSIQRVGFLRFNPFSDTGGDNSFSVALLDQEKNGVLISSLYTREGTRVYGKRVELGKTRYPLLDEEKRVLEQTNDNTHEQK